MLCLLGLLAATAFSSAAPDRADSATPPTIVAGGAAEVSDTRATIGVALGPRDDHTRVRAEWGPTTAYGERTPETQVPPGDDVVAVYRQLKNLEPGTQYHYRWILSNGAGEVVGPDQVFGTGAEGKAADPGPATQGVFVSIAAASGKVRVRRAGRHRFKPLTGSRGVAVGSIIDARRGKVRLTSALPNGATQAAIFHGGRFEVRQSAIDGRVDVHLRGGSFARRCKARASIVADARRRKRRVRRLWARDSSGLYSTYGLNSVATVRGTRWLTVDRCDGTLTRVTKGAVVVRNRRTGKTKLVRAGKSHLVRRGR